MQKAKNLELVFVKKKKESKDTYSFFFDRKKIDFNFKYGQYVKIFLDIKDPDIRGSSRFITLSSSPSDKKYLIFTTKIIKSSFKKALFKLKTGDRVQAFGPVGYFDFDIDSKYPSVFISGGIGITPFLSNLRYLDENKIEKEISLFCSYSKYENILFEDELKRIEIRNAKINVIFTVTKEKKRRNNYNNSRIDQKMISTNVPNYKNSNFFIVGSEKMVDSMYEKIIAMGINKKRIFIENFPGY